MDLADDRFDVTYESKNMTQGEILDVITEAGYAPEIVDPPRSDKAPATSNVDLSQLPAELKEVFTEARRTRTLVLLDFTGPG